MAAVKAADQSSPSVTVKIGDEGYVVRFDFDRLIAIEAATRRTIVQCLSDFAGYYTRPEAFSVTDVGRFIAGCLGVELEEVPTIVPLKNLRDVFGQLIEPFIRAVQDMNGVKPDGNEADPTHAPEASPT